MILKQPFYFLCYKKIFYIFQYNFKHGLKLKVCLMLTVSMSFLMELYNSPHGFFLYFRFSCRDESYPSCPVGPSVDLFFGEPTKRGLVCSF